jgi:hypothetical protein
VGALFESRGPRLARGRASASRRARRCGRPGNKHRPCRHLTSPEKIHFFSSVDGNLSVLYHSGVGLGDRGLQVCSAVIFVSPSKF